MPKGPQTEERAERQARDQEIRLAAQARENIEMHKAADAHLDVAAAALRNALRSLQNVRVARRTAEGQVLKRKLRAVEQAAAALKPIGRDAGRVRATGPDYSDPDLSMGGPGVNG